MLSQFSFSYQHRTYTFDPASPLDISLPVKAGLDTVNCFWADPVEIEVIRVGNFVGSVAEGGACNYQRLHVSPHGNGTHTECFGHISPDPTATIEQCLKKFLFMARLVSIPVTETENGDWIVTIVAVAAALAQSPAPEALIIRTQPNSEDKRTRHYSGENPPYLEPGVGQLLAEHHIQHLLLDLPSVDRELDEGKLTNHHQFWHYPGAPRTAATITELIFVPDEIEDGLYLLNLQIAGIEMDASPSKPVLYLLNEEEQKPDEMMKFEEIIEEQAQADKPTTLEQLVEPFQKSKEQAGALPEAGEEMV